MLEGITVRELLERYPFVSRFLSDQGIDPQIDPDTLLEGLPLPDVPGFLIHLEHFIESAASLLGIAAERPNSLTILPGRDKSGKPEAFDSLTLLPGQIICIVGPTGSGKSRLLADIEWAADGDTPTGRRILIDGRQVPHSMRFRSKESTVALLSQNMNFVIDLPVKEFLLLHAQSRSLPDAAQRVEEVIETANSMSGESFTGSTPVTSLSGGQSRALMIADTAIISASPVILIDEIENAGIDRKRALELLVDNQKIVIMATHDPVLALSGSRRLIIEQGGIRKVLERTDEELKLLAELEQTDRKLKALQQALREGRRLGQ